jgi:hypothetical protein
VSLPTDWTEFPAKLHDAPPVYQGASGQWFVRCPECVQFWGAYRTKRAAAAAFYAHNLRRHA